MKQETSKLGRGLSALLSGKENETPESKSYKVINITLLQPNKEQPRRRFNKKDLEELAKSISSQGMLQPIIVRKINDENFEIVAGERRWRAAQIGGMHEVPVIVRKISDEESVQIALIENIQRENLNPVEEARALQRLLQNNNSNYEELIKLIGKSRSHVSNMIRLLELDEKILNLIEEEKLSMGHARALIGVPDAFELANEIIKKKLNVRDIEKRASKFKKQYKQHKKRELKDPNITDLEKELSEKIGLKTTIEFNEEGSSGSLTLYYSNLDQLDDIMRRLKK